MSGMADHRRTSRADERFKRGIVRHQLHAYLNVYNSHTGRFMGTMGNVSCYGFMLISPWPVMLDEEFEMQLHLPPLGAEAGVLPFRAVARWCRPDQTPGHYDVGFSISDNRQVFAGLAIALKRYFSFMHPIDA